MFSVFKKRNAALLAAAVSLSTLMLVACSDDDDSPAAPPVAVSSSQNMSSQQGMSSQQDMSSQEASSAASSAATTATEIQVKETHRMIAHAMYSDSLTTALALQSAVDAFLAEPTEANLTLAKAAYKDTRAPYQQSEIMRWDETITVGSNTGAVGIEGVDAWEGQVNAWPLDESLIDYVSDGEGGIIPGVIVSGSDEITQELLINNNPQQEDESDAANVATGIHAIEFLLWGQDLNGNNPGAGMRPATDYDVDNCTGGNCDRRRQYLSVVTALLVADLTAMVAEWTEEAANTDGTLAYNFMQSDRALDYMLASMTNMASDELSGARMGSALENGDPEEEHDCFSDLSHVAIYHNFQGVKNAFYGTYASPVTNTIISGPSFSDLIKQADQPTFDSLDAALTTIETKIKTIYDLGEQSPDPIRFDQIIAPTNEYNALANEVSFLLLELSDDDEDNDNGDLDFQEARDILALLDLAPVDGEGD